MRITAFLVSAFLAVAASAQQGPALSELGEKIKAAMDAESRNEAHRARDANRKPIQTLEFLGLESDMTVIEVLPGGGWYTNILGPVLRDDGRLYIGVGAGRVNLDKPGLDKVELLEIDVQFAPTENRAIFDIGEFSFGVENADMVLTFRNLHNLTAAGRAAMNNAAFEALRPGGIYGVVDHTRRHMEELNRENFRRLDPVVAVKEALDAGFEFADFSDLHYRADDELRYEVGRRSVTGNTDRFTFKFVKPE